MDATTQTVIEAEHSARAAWATPQLRVIPAREAEVGPNNTATDGPITGS